MKLYPIFSTLVDVFLGEGWENWSRVTFKRGVATVVAGQQLPPAALQLVKEKMAWN